MNTIYFATGNKGKLASLHNYLKEHDVRVVIEQSLVEMVEPQADTATEVALAKARQAHKALNAPVVVDDSSFHISALGGFPGPYIKYMLMTVGVNGILQLLKNYEDRSAYFLSTLVYIDEHGDEHVFEDAPYRGTIVPEIVTVDRPDAWSELYAIFSPGGTTKVLAELTHEQLRALNPTQDAYAVFAQWLKAKFEQTQ